MKIENDSFQILRKDSSVKDKLVYILEDEADILELISINLEKSGLNTKKFLHPQKFLDQLSKKIPDLIILDLMLPDIDGFEICKFLKSNNNYSSIPVIMLTAKSDELDKLIGFELGTDDYITKPFSPRELIARVKAVLNRAFLQPKPKILRVGKILTVDLDKYNVYLKDKLINLTTTEFKILQLLATYIGRVFSREQIISFIDDEKIVLDRTIDVHIKNLRDKLETAGHLIKNKRGVGYKIDND